MSKGDSVINQDITNFPSFNLSAVNKEEEFLLCERDLADKNFVIYTYPKDLTSGCTKEANDFSTSFNFFKNNGYLIYGLSKDSIKSHVKFIEKESIPFSLISDPECELIKELDCWVKKSMYGKEYMGISRSTFLVNQGLQVNKIWRNVKVKDHVSNVMAEISM